jgi:hypothetical protein
MKAKALQEGIHKGKTFTIKMNYNLNKIPKTIVKEPRGKTKKRIEHLNVFSQCGIVTLQWIDLESFIEVLNYHNKSLNAPRINQEKESSNN